MTEDRHYCVHETEWGELGQSLKTLAECQKNLDKKLNHAFEILFGKDMNGGVVTDIKINAQSIEENKKTMDRLWKMVWVPIGIALASALKVFWK